MEYMRHNYMFNITKNVNDKSVNKLTTLKLIANNDKMPTTNRCLLIISLPTN
jgi:hypothetical protein